MTNPCSYQVYYLSSASYSMILRKILFLCRHVRLLCETHVCSSCFRLSSADNDDNVLDHTFVLMFQLHWIAQSADLLPACYMANTACTIVVIVIALIFVIASRLHAFLLVVLVHLLHHALVAVVAILVSNTQSLCHLHAHHGRLLARPHPVTLMKKSHRSQAGSVTSSSNRL